MEKGLVAVYRYGCTQEAEDTFRGQLEIVRMIVLKIILGVCCTRFMLYWVYAALSVNL